MVGGSRSASRISAGNAAAGGRRVSAGAETPRLQWLLNVGFGIGSRSTVGWDGRRVRWAWDEVVFDSGGERVGDVEESI